MTLLGSPRFIGYALSHAFVLGGLLVFVLGAPAVIVHSLGGTLGDFIRMQVMGVGCFIAAANVTARLVQRHGADRIIMAGTALCALSSVCLLVYALADGRDPLMVALLFLPMNLGLGVRGPPGFLSAIMAADGDDERAASLTVLFITGVSAGGTALLAPYIDGGLPVLAGAVALLQMAALMITHRHRNSGR